LSAAAVFSTISAGRAQYDDPGVLTIEASPGKSLASYTAEQLQQAFPQQELETIVPWLKDQGKTLFRGPYLKDVLAKHGLGKHGVLAIAFDEYTADISAADIDTYAPIVATQTACTAKDHASGLCAKDQAFRALRREENGFFRLIWPFDRLPASSSENDPRWIWALIVLRPAP
ncbi:MAG: hypothetical protein ACRECY_07855, partial [Phyllobacterium sp.]